MMSRSILWTADSRRLFGLVTFQGHIFIATWKRATADATEVRYLPPLDARSASPRGLTSIAIQTG